MDELKKYCLGSKLKNTFRKIGFVLLFLFFYVFGFIMLDAMNLAKTPLEMPALILAGFLIFVFLLAYRKIFIEPNRFFNERIEYFRQNNLLQLVLNDFSQGVRKCAGRVIFGYNCIIAKECGGYIFFYNEITKACIYTETTYTEDPNTGRRDSKTTDYLAVVVNGTQFSLCEYIGRRNEWNEMKTFLKLKNPNIQVS